MTFAVVEARATTPVGSALTSHSVNLPSGIVDGDLLIVSVSWNEGGTTSTFPAGWTRLITRQQININQDIHYRQADGTEGATITVTLTTAEFLIGLAYRFSGAELVATQAPQAASAGLNSDLRPDPPNLTPTGGAKDYLWLATMTKNSSSGLSDTPDNYGSLIQEGTGFIGRTASMERALNAASENPTSYNSANNAAWVAFTIAVHPSSIVSAAVTGTIIGDTELDIRNGGSTIILTLTNDTWVAAGPTFDAQRQNIIDGLDSGGVEVNGWDAAVRPAFAVTDVVRTSNTVVTITVPTAGVPGYNITLNETITVTIPASALVLEPDPVVASPTVVITFLTETAVLSGTLFFDDEAGIRSGGSTIVLTLTNTEWEANVGADNLQTQALIDGLGSDLAEANGWDAVVQAGLTFADVTRNSNTVVTILMPAFPTYNITVNETITPTLPASALELPVAIVATPTLLVTVFPLNAAVIAAAVTSIDTGTPHTVTLPSGIVAGNLLIILFATREFIDNPTLANWTRIVEANIESDPNGRITFAVFTRRADGTEGASVDVTTTFSVDSAHIAYRITGDDGGQSPEVSLSSFVVTNTPNPPALTPTDGPKAFLWLTMAVTQKDLSGGAFPTDYGNLLSADAVGIEIHAIRRNRSIATEDPGTPSPPGVNLFTLTDPGDPDITLGVTLAIHPLPAGVSAGSVGVIQREILLL